MTDFSLKSTDQNENYIVDLPETPNSQLNGSTNRLILPSIQDVSLYRNSRINEIIELNKTQQKIKSLEVRLQATEVSNRTLIGEVVRLQNEMINSLRANLETLNEEKSARQSLETNMKFQNDAYIKTNNRLKQTEEQLQENRNAMQSLIKYTRNLENHLLESQRGLFAKKDFQASRLEELKKEINDLNYSKENLERYTNSLLEEIKSLKNKVEYENSSINAIGGDLKYKTQRLEDENRQQLDVIMKHKDSLTFTENQLQLIKTDQESKIKEIRDFKIEMKQKLDFEIEKRKSNDSSTTAKILDLTTKLDEEKSKFIDLFRDFESFKRDTNTRSEENHNRLLHAISNSKEIIWSNTLEKFEKFKNDIQLKLRELEGNVKTESEKIDKFKQSFHVEIDSKINYIQNSLYEEINQKNNETGNNLSKLNDSLKKLNEGLTLIERQNEERNRRFEKVLNAEINSRKSKDVDLNEKLDNYNEKFSVSIQSFQANVAKLNSRIDSTKEEFIARKEFENAEKKIEEQQAAILQNNLKISSLKQNFDLSETNLQQQAAKIKELNDLVSQIDNSKLILINDRIDKLPTKEDFFSFKVDTDQKIEEEIQRIIKQNDKQYSDIKRTADDRYDQLNNQLTISNNKFQQKLNINEKLIKDQISLQNEYQQKYMSMFKEETRASIVSYDDKKQEDLAYLEEKIQNRIDLNKHYYEKKVETLQQEIKNEMSSIKKEIKNFKNENTQVVNKDINDQI